MIFVCLGLIWMILVDIQVQQNIEVTGKNLNMDVFFYYSSIVKLGVVQVRKTIRQTKFSLALESHQRGWGGTNRIPIS